MLRVDGIVRITCLLTLAAASAVGCSTQPQRTPSPSAPTASASRATPTTSPASHRGAEVAAELTTQYRDTRQDCGGANRPAFLCSGVLFRGTQASTLYHSWNPSPTSQQRGGVSFSFLRADSKFNRLAYDYNNGLIFQPYQLTATGKLNPEVLCVFPIDGWTFQRGDKGCGAHETFPAESRPCQAQGITTAQQWATHFNLTSGNKNTHQCGFDVRENINGSAAYFVAGLAARGLISAVSFGQTDELMVATWAQMENPTSLPIQAFFYLPGGLAGAQHDQKDYYRQAGSVVPIIAMMLPATAANDASFEYREQDQAEEGTEPPLPGEGEDFETVPLGLIYKGTTLTTRHLEIYAGAFESGAIVDDVPGSRGHFLWLIEGGLGSSKNIPRVTFIKESSAVSFKGAYFGTLSFHAADGAILGSLPGTVPGGGLQTITFRSPDARKIKYMELTLSVAGNGGASFDDFSFPDR